MVLIVRWVVRSRCLLRRFARRFARRADHPRHSRFVCWGGGGGGGGGGGKGGGGGDGRTLV